MLLLVSVVFLKNLSVIPRENRKYLTHMSAFRPCDQSLYVKQWLLFVLSLFLFCSRNYLFIWVAEQKREEECESRRESELSITDSLPQMTATARSQPGQSQEPRTLSWHPTLVSGCESLEPSSVALAGALAGNLVGSSVPGTQNNTLWWDVSIRSGWT